jgi:hypothetical protein
MGDISRLQEKLSSTVDFYSVGDLERAWQN